MEEVLRNDFAIMLDGFSAVSSLILIDGIKSVGAREAVHTYSSLRFTLSSTV